MSLKYKEGLLSYTLLSNYYLHTSSSVTGVGYMTPLITLVSVSHVGLSSLSSSPVTLMVSLSSPLLLY